MNMTATLTKIASWMVILAVLNMSPSARGQYFYDSKVDLDFNHLYDFDEMTDAMRALVRAYPDLLTMESIGKSEAGRDLWLVTMNNPKTGEHTDKPAMWIDGNIHGNEVQAAETVLYSIWYLTKSYGRIDKITKLVDERAFYFMPMVNPDGRMIWFDQPATPHFLRGGVRPTDNDYDGLYDEDGYDDLDGDGHITWMWVKDPLGRYERDPDDDRFFRRVGADDEPGGWRLLGTEGIDNDGDGQVNEDGPGGYDPNRNWPSDWQPNYIQFGAGDYPFSLPETRAVGEFLFAHPNVAAFQSYHNTGGMILRGPATKYMTYPREDIAVFEALQETGVEMLPGYRAYVTHENLYTVHGGEKGWAYEGLGIIGFTNELWTPRRMYWGESNPDRAARRKFRDLLQFEEVLVPYTEVEHPTYGTVLVGGAKKWSSRVPPPWMLEEECHRNFAFTMYHADQMPKVEFGHVGVRRTNAGLWEVTVEVKNTRLIPTIVAIARRNGIGARDRMHCDGKGVEVVASGTVSSLLPWAKMNAQEHKGDLSRVWNGDGIGGRSQRIFRFLVQGNSNVELRYVSQKGGTIRATIPLEARDLKPLTDGE